MQAKGSPSLDMACVVVFIFIEEEEREPSLSLLLAIRRAEPAATGIPFCRVPLQLREEYGPARIDGAVFHSGIAEHH
jgi:hypothetical protein